VRRLSWKEGQELAGLPERIEVLEAEQRALHARLADPALYQAGATEVGRLQSRLTELSGQLTERYDRWSELAERAE
jgi:ATP-binding cassette subfamily F protein uup